MGAYVYPVDNWQTTDGARYTGRRLRQMLGAVLTRGAAARPLGARSGVTAGTPSSTLSVGSGSWTVAPHTGILDVEDSAIAGAYWYSIDAAVTGSVPAANASQTRYDLVVVQASDPTEADGSQTPGVAVNYVTGTPGGTLPAAPAHSMMLGYITVPPAGAGNPSATWGAPTTVASGGILPARSSAEYPPAPYAGQYLDDASLGRAFRFDGTKWQPATPAFPDVDWQPLSLAGGMSTNGAVAPALCRVSGLVMFRGQFKYSSTMAAGSAYTVGGPGSAPAGFRPAVTTEIACAAANGATQLTCRIAVTSDGQVVAYPGAATAYVALGALQYRAEV